MAAVFATEASVRQMLRQSGERLDRRHERSRQHRRVRHEAAVAAVLARLEPAGVRCERLVVSHAFHSALMDPILDEFERAAGQVEFTTPRIGIVSNLTGRIADPREMSTAGYWRRHLRETVRFADGITALHAEGVRVFLEIGPSPTLLSLGRRTVSDESVTWLPTLRRGRDDWKQIADAVSRLYVERGRINWAGFDAGYVRQKLALPTYPFQRQSYWIENAAPRTQAVRSAASIEPAVRDLAYELNWQPAVAKSGDAQGPGRDIDQWLIFPDRSGVARELAAQLGRRAAKAAVVAIDPSNASDYRRILTEAGSGPGTLGVVFLGGSDDDGGSACEHLLSLSKALIDEAAPGARLWIVTRGAQPAGGAPTAVGPATLWGFGRVLALEHPEVFGGLIDLDPAAPAGETEAAAGEITSGSEEQVALRDGLRFVPRLAKRTAAASTTQTCAGDATYLITGGTGSLGLKVAAWLVDRGARHLVLVSRRGLPDRAASANDDAAAAVADAVAAARVAWRRGSGDQRATSPTARVYGGHRRAPPLAAAAARDRSRGRRIQAAADSRPRRRQPSRGSRTEGGRRPEPARADRRSAAGFLHPVFVDLVGVGVEGAGALRGGEPRARRACPCTPRGRARGARGELGAVERRGHGVGRRSALARGDRHRVARAVRGAWRAWRSGRIVRRAGRRRRRQLGRVQGGLHGQGPLAAVRRHRIRCARCRRCRYRCVPPRAGCRRACR